MMDSNWVWQIFFVPLCQNEERSNSLMQPLLQWSKIKEFEVKIFSKFCANFYFELCSCTQQPPQSGAHKWTCMHTWSHSVCFLSMNNTSSLSVGERSNTSAANTEERRNISMPMSSAADCAAHLPACTASHSGHFSQAHTPTSSLSLQRVERLLEIILHNKHED